MMSRRPSAASLAAAIRSNIGEARNGHPSDSNDQLGWKRTTFKAPSEAIIALRSLALHSGCTMNDLIMIAIGDFLEAAGKPCGLAVKAGLREQIMNDAATKDATNESP